MKSGIWTLYIWIEINLRSVEQSDVAFLGHCEVNIDLSSPIHKKSIFVTLNNCNKYF